MSFFKEFKDFAMRGNVMDLAVGIIIGAAFGKIVSSLVADVIMPPIGLLVGGVNFTDLAIKMPSPLSGVEAVTINYGNFIQTVFDFTIVAFAIFLLIRTINRFSRKKVEEPAGVPEASTEEKLLTEIRDLLKKQIVK